MFEITIKNYNAGEGVTYDEYLNVKSYKTTGDEKWLQINDYDGTVFFIKTEQILEFTVERLGI